MSHIYALNGELHAAEDWTDPEIARLRTLWAEGLSTAKIGRQLGRSKSSVVGKAHRLDLPARPSPIRGHSAKPRTPKLRSVGALPTLPQFARACFQCGGLLGVDQDKFCSDGCTQLHELAALAVRKPTRKREPKEPEQLPARSEPCCWITSDGKPWTMCGKPSLPGKPYCAEHASKSYVRRSDLLGQAIA